jgi:hypothetical protein
VREYIGANHEYAEEDGHAHQVEFMFECHVGAGYRPRMGPATDAYQTGVDWLPLTDLQYYRLYPQVLKPILANGIGEEPVIYLGDVN